jgi:NAD(P)-dependent dehydrogenase (short-subunit alcohol dehydrogenase family)
MANKRKGCPVVLVTGASRGLGRGIALELAGAGCSVAVNFASNLDAARETAALCRARAPLREQRFVTIKANIADSADRARLVRETAEAMGRIDALVNNAGRAAARSADLCDTTEESFDELMRTNLKGPYFLTQAVANYWIGSRREPLLDGGFKVVFITSVSAEVASVNRGEYCVSKAGLSMASRLWAARLAQEGITEVELRPGIMETDMTSPRKAVYDQRIAAGEVPLRRWGTPLDLGLAVKAVITGQFPFTTGAIITVDGGLSVPRL